VIGATASGKSTLLGNMILPNAEAGRGIVLCGGAINTPQVLQLSGERPATTITSRDPGTYPAIRHAPSASTVDVTVTVEGRDLRVIVADDGAAMRDRAAAKSGWAAVGLIALAG
jgi:ABC-type cobalamin/Fe3+-siderophores transport system ATPase subunit